MRINATRLGLILVILGAVLLFNIWSAPVVQSSKASIGTVGSGETFAYGLFIAPVGLGNLVVEGDTMVLPVGAAEPIRVEYVVPAHLVVVSPSDVVLVDVDIVTPYTAQVDFDERGEYVVYVTNMGEESYPIPISVKFPRNGDVVNREADKFFVSTILLISGVTLLCLGLSLSLIIKHRKISANIVGTFTANSQNSRHLIANFDYYLNLNRGEKT